MHRMWFVFTLCLCTCSAVIYHLNESEYARMPPLYGLDDYGSCLIPADGTYCLVRVDLHAAKDDRLIRLIQEYSENKVKHYNHTYLQRGVCVTSTCKDHIKNINRSSTNEDLICVLEACLNDTIFKEYGLKAELTKKYYCERKGEPIDIDIADWIVMGIYIAIAVINVIGTLYDVSIAKCGAPVKGNKYLLCFSIIQNWNRLVSLKTKDDRMESLTGLHGVRVMALFLMFVGHVIWVNSLSYNDNIQEFEELYENAYYQLIFNGLVVVQVFFVMSGFLLVYNLEIYAEKHNMSWSLGVKIWIMRWWRLTPSYAVVIAFSTTWLRHLGSGPLWRMFVTDSVTGACRQYWWAHLLYINNYIADGHYCALHTWHIATDTQLFCIGLLVYLVTRRGGKYSAMGVLIALGIVLPAAHVWAWDLDGLVLMTPEFYRSMTNDTFHYMHVYGHTNLAGYSAGMLAGYLVYRMQRNAVNVQENKLCIFLSWMILPSIAGLFYSGSVFYRDGERPPLAARMAYAAVQRLIIGVAVAFGLVGLCMKLNTTQRKLFEWKVWVVPSRLSYSVYLLHLYVIHAHVGGQRNLGHSSTFNMTLIHFGVILMSFMVALPFSVLVEAPLMRLMKVATVEEDKEQTKF